MADEQEIVERFESTSPITCKQGHVYYGLACDTCAARASLELLMYRSQRAIVTRHRKVCAMGHITATQADWERITDDLLMRKNDLHVPALCGALLPFSKLRRAAADVKTECKLCESELLKLK